MLENTRDRVSILIELKLRKILRQLKNKNPQVRYEAIHSLHMYKQMKDLEIQIDLLKDMIKAAASSFPERVDNWDNPSYYLIDFVCDFPKTEIVEGILQNFDGFDLHAKERAVEFLLLTENDRVFWFLEEKIVQLMRTEKFAIPYKELSGYPVLIKGILDHTLDLLESSYYKFMMYDLLLSLNYSGYEKGYQKETILPILLKHYQAEKEEYLKYNSEYSSKFVYTAWKDNYRVIRNRMRLFISLMEYYFDNQIAEELSQALQFRDPMLKTEALLICMNKKLPYNEETLMECAVNIESAEMLYWELKENHVEHLYPISKEKQPHLAKTRLFSTIINMTNEDEELSFFPENFEIVDHIEIENAYGQPVRYYLVSFHLDGRVYAGWAGGYALEDGDDTASIWDGTYTDFIEFESHSVEEHKEIFHQKRMEEQKEYENNTYYESSPKLSMGAWFFIALLISHWIRMTLNGFNGFMLPSMIFTVLGGGLCYFEIIKNKKRKISIIGHYLIKQDGGNENRIRVEDIKRIEYNKKHVFVYSYQNETAIRFPLRWVNYELFYIHIMEKTAHLKKAPYIQA